MMTSYIIASSTAAAAPRPSRESPSWNRKMQEEFYRHPFVLTHATKDEHWPLEQLHDFCWKACAIYDTVDLPVPARAMLFNYIWARWFRKGETQCEFGNNFAKRVACWDSTSPKTVPEIIEANQAICAQVSRRQNILDTEDSNIRHHCHAHVEHHAGYKLQPTFRAVLIIIDEEPSLEREGTWANWEEHRVLLVRTGDSIGLKTGPVDFSRIDPDARIEAGGSARRISFGKAMDFILDLQQKEDIASIDSQE